MTDTMTMDADLQLFHRCCREEVQRIVRAAERKAGRDITITKVKPRCGHVWLLSARYDHRYFWRLERPGIVRE